MEKLSNVALVIYAPTAKVAAGAGELDVWGHVVLGVDGMWTPIHRTEFSGPNRGWEPFVLNTQKSCMGDVDCVLLFEVLELSRHSQTKVFVGRSQKTLNEVRTSIALSVSNPFKKGAHVGELKVKQCERVPPPFN